ncbi:hypothetical protein H6G76_30850 [Nostoc sp. FACHB-152]|uniref:hypothetical protein n=1 Tax=unclassified Nostoc TaxID=2593658 RepID=UPI0016830C37|nr:MULTISPECIES: hypothetical protein [unclassified Nostoc]MBD2451444.1 hypothetical protein [Nostoc sp. FACHB-152]MBD2472812.1 hypothetical protein [Nostoc sp. FACHB-145]
MSLAGIGRRSQQQVQPKISINSWNPTNCIFLLGAVVSLSTSSFIITSAVLSELSSIDLSPTGHPTSIPWLNNKFDCQHTGRTWENGKCWDAEHNPMF